MSKFSSPKICQHCGYYAQVRRRTVNQGWQVAEWGECRKTDLTKTGVMTPENETCADFTPDPRRWPLAGIVHIWDEPTDHIVDANKKVSEPNDQGHTPAE